MSALRIRQEASDNEIFRLLRYLDENGAYAASDGKGACAVFTARARRRAGAKFPGAVLEVMRQRDLLVPAQTPGDAEGWRLSGVGLAFLKRCKAHDDPFRAQHQEHSASRATPAGAGPGVRINHAESPLAWLHRRHGPGGRPLISQEQFKAGERLRTDFTRAGMTPRMTVDWSAPICNDVRRSAPQIPAEAALIARQRFDHAVRAVGPGLSDVLIEVCCYIKGLTDVERRLGWPRRSAKVVLLIALSRLADHYGFGSDHAPPCATP